MSLGNERIDHAQAFKFKHVLLPSSGQNVPLLGTGLDVRLNLDTGGPIIPFAIIDGRFRKIIRLGK
jgi:hypothetical protein